MTDHEEEASTSFVAINGHATGNGRDVAAVWWGEGDCHLVFVKEPAARWSDMAAVSVGAMGGDDAEQAALRTANGGPDSLDDGTFVKTMAEMVRGPTVEADDSQPPGAEELEMAHKEDLATLRQGLAAGKQHGLPEGLMEALNRAAQVQSGPVKGYEPENLREPAPIGDGVQPSQNQRRPGARRGTHEAGAERGH